uniref:PM2 protein n=1 Tax=Triticum aestivum TaxID=4565 RepID=A0A160YJE1_WHEAT|nr:PM2 protein [Triticum aestivum]
MAASAALVFAGKSVATSAISFLVNKAFSYIDEYCKSENMDELKNRLLRAMPHIQAVFDVVNPELVREQSSGLDAWLWQLRDAVEAAEDAIDELEYYELEEKAKDQKVSEWGSPLGKMKHKFVRSFGPAINKTIKKISHRDTLKRLMKSVDDLDKAAVGVSDFLKLTDHLSGGSSTSSQQLMDNDRQTSSTSSATNFVGREKEKEQIIGWLANTSDELGETMVIKTNSIPIISVIGHGGMGKTALAQSICGQDEVVKHFKVIWTTISTSFDATSVTSKILEDATRVKPSSDHLEPLQRDLKEKLASINFLLVLDDVWEDKKRDEWEKLFAPLKELNTTGSKILLTTRMQSVADMAAKVMGVERDKFLTLQGLEDDKNLKLFGHHAFSGLNPRDDAYLMLIGEQIAKKLRGCPLVTKVVAEHLQSNITPEYWRKFLHQGLEHFKGTEKDIMKVLRLSYYHLPTELQICFRYCCLFPQDYIFEKKELVQMWIGSGLIASGIQSLEDTAEQFLAQLTRKSFFDKKPIWAQSEFYVMHDLMHELASNVSTGECARIVDPVQLQDEKYTVRHLCIANIHSFSADEVKKISHFKNLRTIIIDCMPPLENDTLCALQMIVETSKSLRLFHSAQLWNTSRFAVNFGNLKHLRYICVSSIPQDKICGVARLYHLMVLHHGSSGTKIDEARYLGNLERLRYVSYGVHGFGNFPISRLTSLQELHNYRVEERTCNQISAVGSLRDLRRLGLQGLENVKNWEEAKNAKLKEKQYLNSLFMEWSTPDQIMTDNLVLDHLEPHVNIRELQIGGYPGLKIPSWIENCSVRNLISLKLISCINWDYIPSLCQLVLLELLVLDNLPKLRQIGRSSDMSKSSSMELLLPQSLNTLEVSKCQKLRELPLLPPSLISLKIHDVWLTKFPIIGKVSSESIESKSSKLINVRVTNCPHLTSLEGSLLEQKLYMGTLRVLTIVDCKHLESASIPFEEMKQLKELAVMQCPKLRTMRDAKDKLVPSSLRELAIGGCGDLELPLLGSLQLLTNLSGLELQNCSSLLSLPSADVFKSFRSLQNIHVTRCENLSSLGGLGSLSSLQQLAISKCSKLTEAGSSLLSGSGDAEEHLVEPGNSLRISVLSLDLPSLLLHEPLKSLCHTEYLCINGCSETKSLPERWLLQNRSSLRHLGILKAESLESLPPSMQDLCSLKSLYLDGALLLRSLPYLPSSLKNLNITECHPDLEKKITKHGSSELNKIAHIPDVTIGGWHFLMGKKFSREAYHKLSDSDRNRFMSESSLH